MACEEGTEGRKGLEGDYCFSHYKHPPGECKNPDWSVFKICQSLSEYVFLNLIG